MRFIIQFIFFGLLFYAIYAFFPDAFMKLVTWAADLFDFIKDTFHQLFKSTKTTPDSGTHTWFSQKNQVKESLLNSWTKY